MRRHKIAGKIITELVSLLTTDTITDVEGDRKFVGKRTFG